jgi:hypothetical protein
MIKRIIYWITTLLVSAMMGFSAFAYLTHQPMMTRGFADLGYPPYFQNILGVAKVLGVLVLLSPGLKRLKEWAYAGFVITFISAFVSHMEMGEQPKAAAPVVALVVLLISYFTRPPGRVLR